MTGPRCESYHTHINYLGKEVAECWGTKESDECTCGGDQMRCDFYPNVRTSAIQTYLNQKAWYGGDINRGELVRRLAEDKRQCPEWVFDIIGEMDTVRPV